VEDSRAGVATTVRQSATLQRRLVLWGICLTWAVGGVVGAEGWRLIALTVRGEAEARVRDAVRVAWRMLDLELDRLAPAEQGTIELSATEAAGAPGLVQLVAASRRTGQARGFVLVPERGLCLAAALSDPGSDAARVVVRPLRGENRLPDQIRDVVFGTAADGRSERATLTLFEGDVRIATNVVTAAGERAVGTRAAPEVARRVLGEGRPWNDRARVLDRWTITSYEPIRSVGGEIVGMLYAGLDEAPYVAAGRRNVAVFLASIFALTVVVSGLVWWLGRRVARPLGALTRAASALGEGDHEQITVAASDPAEIRLLGETFNCMADQIRARTTELELSRAAAQKALDDYLEVLGFVAHELKSPLAGAQMQLRLIADGYAGEVPAALGRPLAALGRAVDYGHEVAQSFNQLSRAESEGFRARPRRVADFVAEVIRPALTDFDGAAAARGMRLVLDGEGGSVEVDPDLMRVVMDNLIGNAVKYGRDGGEVTVTARLDDTALRVEVRNQGVGVPAEATAKLFSKFYRVQDPATSATKGTGVGLYLVRRFVELHGGTVAVDGEYGSWVAFSLTIPLRPAAGRDYGVAYDQASVSPDSKPSAKRGRPRSPAG